LTPAAIAASVDHQKRVRKTMHKPLAGIKVVECAMWAFVPVAGGILADMGAEVIKIEPVTGDPIRGLVTGAPRDASFDFGWEAYNRGKKSFALDIREEAGLTVLYQLLEDADVFLTNILPPARERLKIDMDTLKARFPKLIYATGSGVGQRGPEKDKGGFDAITFWARGGIASTMTSDGADSPVSPAGPAFGDTLSGSMLAGGIAAAIAQRAMTGHASSVDISLLGAAMWSMQRLISHSTYAGIDRFPRPAKAMPNNVLVNTYRTKDDRFLSLCMLQADRYWARLCELAGRPDMAVNPRFRDAPARRNNVADCVAELNAIFARKTLAQWRVLLAQQDGQWDVVQHVGELKDDPQVIANDYLQALDAGEGKSISLVSAPMQFDGAALSTSRAPEVGADSDAILSAMGYVEEAIIDLKVAGVVL
jgi:crotonobetainyl-CoA:carnitine CoA-transferase CaiB-like acyl-CoA transferase